MSGWNILGILLLLALASSLVVLWIGGAFHDARVRYSRDLWDAENDR